MSTTLLACEQELSKQLGDYWTGTTTSAGITDGTTLIDTALTEKQVGWIGDDMYGFLTITGGAHEYEERQINTFTVTSGTLLFTLPHSAQVTISSDYEIHRLFSPSEKRRALIAAARLAFPHIHEKIWDESIVSGNWLKDGSIETWTISSTPTYWGKSSTETLAQTSTSLYYKHGSYSCKMTSATGYLYQDIATWDDLKHLAGKHVKFSAQVHADTTGDCRLGILYDGTNLAYSSYHAGGTAWTEHGEPLEVEYELDNTPTDLSFRVYKEQSTGTVYVDDLRVIASSMDKPRLYIADLGLAQEQPHEVFIEPSNYSQEAIWPVIHNTDLDSENGYLHLPTGVLNDRRLRIRGMGYLDFLASGVSSTSWAATININAPQTDILIAQAILYLYTEMAMPNRTVGDRRDYQEMIGFWQGELSRRIGRHRMPLPSIQVKWR